MFYFVIIIVFLFALLSIAPGFLDQEWVHKIEHEAGKTLPVELGK